MTELSFLLDLFLNHKMPAKTKAHVAERLNELAGRMTTHMPSAQPMNSGPVMVAGVPQAASTAALMAKHGMAVSTINHVVPEPIEPPGIAGATAATALALESRQSAIRQAQLGKPEPGRTSPRKF